jgi:MerR family mercuric resistance operon transcriptional regulator
MSIQCIENGTLLPLDASTLIIDVAPECKVKADSDFFLPGACPDGRKSLTVGGNGRKPPRATEKAMAGQYTISQLARAVGVPTTTLRYYERAGLLEPEDRSQGNYRLYTDESLRRLKFIRAAQSIGFTLEDVKTLLGSHEDENPSCPGVQVLIQARLADIEERLKDLCHVQRVLKSALQKCRKSEQIACCHVIETLRLKSRV